MFQTLSPTDLQSLFDAFALLEHGSSVCLTSEFDLQSVVAQDRASPSHHSPFVLPSSPSLGLYSSGSTGTPKLCWRPWPQLKSEVRLREANHGWTWASPFAPSTFAGVQVALQAWAASGQILSLTSGGADNLTRLTEKNVQALSCTPTFLDLMLQQATSSSYVWNPRQITLGGEPLRSAAGVRFRNAFPHTRFTAIYASAEFGVLLKTHRLDGWYELASLQTRFPRWRIESSELQVWTNDNWQSTRDLAQLDRDVICIIGRADAVANVAGCKVSLDEVARLAEQVPGVRTALAFAEASPVSGQIVALRFNPEDGLIRREVQARLETYLRQHLRKEAWPRRWEIGPIDLGPNSKRALPTKL